MFWPLTGSDSELTLSLMAFGFHQYSSDCHLRENDQHQF
jgi:hypothetical protein